MATLPVELEHKCQGISYIVFEFVVFIASLVTKEKFVLDIYKENAQGLDMDWGFKAKHFVYFWVWRPNMLHIDTQLLCAKIGYCAASIGPKLLNSIYMLDHKVFAFSWKGIEYHI